MGVAYARDHAPSPTPGIDVPDHRGRTGLDRTGRDLDGNPRVRIVDVELLAAGWHVLRRTTLDYRDASGALEPPAARDLRSRQRRHRPALRPRAPDGAADAPVPVPGVRQRPPGRDAGRDRRRTARRRRSRDRDPPRGRGGDGRRGRRARARLRRVHEPGLGDRADPLLRGILRFRLAPRRPSPGSPRRARRSRSSSSTSTRRWR